MINSVAISIQYYSGDNGTVPTTMVMPRHRWGHVSAFIGMYCQYKYIFLSNASFSLFFLPLFSYSFLGFTLYICGGSTELAGNFAPNDTCDTFDAGSK